MTRVWPYVSYAWQAASDSWKQKKQNNTRDDGLLYQDFGRRQRRKGKLREGKIEKKKEELRRESTKKKNKRNEDITL